MEGSAEITENRDNCREEGGVPRVFSRIKLRYIASGAKEEELKKAIEESMKKYCSVSAMLEKVEDIEYEVLR